MLIEYKIKFEKNGLTIAQYIEPNSVRMARGAKNGKGQVNGLPAAQHEVPALLDKNPLAMPSAESGGPHDETMGPHDETMGPHDETMGVNGQGSAPIFILGPIVFGGAEPTEITKPVDSTTPDGPPKARGAAA